MAAGDDVRVIDEGFDAELALRLLGEDALLDPVTDNQRRGFGSPVIDVASALVAIDALPVDRARSIARDYELALSMRGDNRSHSGMFLAMAPPPAPPVDPAPLRTVRCHETFTTPAGLVTTYGAWLDPDGTVVVLSAVPAQRNMLGLQSVSPTLTDDQGTSLPAHFSGGGHGDRVRGQVATFPGLSVDTAWLELGGHRVALHDVPPPAGVTVEELPPATLAQRHLWRCVTAFAAEPGGIRHGGVREDRLEPVAAVLVASGALDPDDAELRQARAVVAALLARSSTATEGPAQWQSLLSRMQRSSWHLGSAPGDDHEVVLVGASVVVDEAVVRVQTVERLGEMLAISVDVAPGSALAVGGRDVGDESLRWWAEDDLGNSYLGCPSSAGGSPGRSSGTIEFVPALDQAATHVRILPTGATQRGIVPVALPPRATAS
jgi:hypothetical protein